MGSKFITELGVIKLVKNTYSVTNNKYNDDVIACFGLQDALNLQKELTQAIDAAKDHRKTLLYEKISKSRQSITEMQADIAKWQDELKSFDAIN